MKRLIKLMSLALCLTMVLSASLVGVFALSMNGVTLADGFAEESKATADEAPLFKDETVYVMANADGTVEKIIVSDWIKNNKKADIVTDLNTLGEIESVKTDATFTLNSENMREWKADGKDLYLQGTGKEKLPVDLNVTYALDGQVISPSDLVGKSGDVTIRFDYTNNQYETVKIDGKEERIYVPFFMMSGLFLDSSKFSNVKVTNGKVVSDGERIIIAGIAFPGLRHDLGLTKKEINLPEHFEITAHVEDFELGTTITIATNGLFNEMDASKLNDLDDLNSALGKLDTAMKALIDGSSALYSGMNTLLESSGTLTSGVDTLYSGAVQLKNGAAQVDSGAAELDTGAKQLSTGSVSVDLGALNLYSGLSTLNSNSTALTSGGDATFSALLAAAKKSLTDAGLDVPDLTQKNYATELQKIIDSLAPEKVKEQAEAAARAQVAAKVEENRETIVAGVTAAVRQNVEAEVTQGVRAQVTASVLSALGYSVDEYNAAVEAGLVTEDVQTQVNTGIETQMGSDTVASTIATLTDQNMQGEAAQSAITTNTEAQINSLIDENMKSEEVQQKITAALTAAATGRQNVIDLKTQLDNYGTFNTGLKTYTGGVGSASAGASQLHSGTTSLKDGAWALSAGSSKLHSGTTSLSQGAVQLTDGILKMKNGMPALTDGVTKLRDGSMTLSDGLKTFNAEGISKITSLKDTELGTIAARLQAMSDVSKHYKSYSGLTDEMDGEVKFIYKTKEIKAEK